MSDYKPSVKVIKEKWQMIEEFLNCEVEASKSNTLEEKTIYILDDLVMDEDLEILSMTVCMGDFEGTELEKKLIEKLDSIYRIVHGCNKYNICYTSHESWREEIEESFSSINKKNIERFEDQKCKILEELLEAQEN